LDSVKNKKSLGVKPIAMTYYQKDYLLVCDVRRCILIYAGKTFRSFDQDRIRIITIIEDKYG